MSASGLYVHVPFCHTKCGYCDFYSVPPQRVEAWVEAVIAEARLRASAFGRFTTLYLGGGTPSLLTEPQLAALITGLRASCDLAPGAEITLEVNPDDVSLERLAHWRWLGISRLSLGLQAVGDDDLVALGRRHTADQGWSAMRLARLAGFDNLGVDLIWGLPGQSLETWAATLEEILAGRPEHLSCYQLTLEPHTPLARELAAGGPALPDEERARRFFLFTSRYLTERGYEHYEVSNFAWGRRHRSRHNQLYWQHAPYLGLGPAAHSFDGRRRWWNVRSVDRYLEMLAAGRAPTDGAETLGAQELRLEEVMLGLRTADGVSSAAIEHYPGWEATIAALGREQLAYLLGGRLRPTPAGLAVADGLPLRFAS